MISPGIKVISELTLLGAPMTENSIRTVLEKKKIQLKILFQRLTELDNNHIAFHILRNCSSFLFEFNDLFGASTPL